MCIVTTSFYIIRKKGEKKPDVHRFFKTCGRAGLYLDIMTIWQRMHIDHMWSEIRISMRIVGSDIWRSCISAFPNIVYTAHIPNVLEGHTLQLRYNWDKIGIGIKYFVLRLFECSLITSILKNEGWSRPG